MEKALALAGETRGSDLHELRLEATAAARAAEAWGKMARHLEDLASEGARVARPRLAAERSALHLARGDLAEAQRLARRALKRTAPNDVEAALTAREVLVRLALMAGAREEAERQAHAALSLGASCLDDDVSRRLARLLEEAGHLTPRSSPQRRPRRRRARDAAAPSA